MTIKITGLELTKGKLEHIRNENKDLYHRHNLEGKLKVKVTERNISANTEYDIFNVSDELKGKLVDLLDEIQDELNGVKREFVGVNASGQPVYKEKNNNKACEQSRESDANKEVDVVSEVLSNVEKVLNVIINFSEPKNKTASELVEEIAKIMRENSKWLY